MSDEGDYESDGGAAEDAELDDYEPDLASEDEAEEGGEGGEGAADEPALPGRPEASRPGTPAIVDVRAVRPPIEPAAVMVDDVVSLNAAAETVEVVRGLARRTDSRLHVTEAAAVLAARAKQIADTGMHFVPDDVLAAHTGAPDSLAIARLELLARRCPLRLRREIARRPGLVTVEEWSVNELSLPPLDF